MCISGSNVQKLQILLVSDNIFGMIAQSKNCWLIERHLHSTAGLVATTAFSCKNKIPSILYPPSNPRQINYVHCQCSDNLIWNLHQLFPRCAYFSAEKRGMQLRKIPKKTLLKQNCPLGPNYILFCFDRFFINAKIPCNLNIGHHFTAIFLYTFELNVSI